MTINLPNPVAKFVAKARPVGTHVFQDQKPVINHLVVRVMGERPVTTPTKIKHIKTLTCYSPLFS